MLDVAERIADAVLAPAAADVDQADSIPPGHLRALADAGCFGIAAPASVGGAEVDAPTMRRAMATIAGGCGATFFVWVQHHGVVRLLSTAEVDRHEQVVAFAAGDAVAGTAFAHLRRIGPPAVTATKAGNGWRLDGVAPWATSWGIAESYSIAAETEAGEVVWSMLDLGPDRPRSGLAATPLDLPVFGATRTVELHFDGVVVEADEVVATQDAAGWRRSDRVRAAMGSPAPLGIAARVARHLRSASDAALAERVEGAVARCWTRDDQLLDRAASAQPSAEAIEAFVAEASRHRAEVSELGRTAAALFLAAVGGRGMDLAHPAQRLAREADFFVVQAQTADGRRAAVERLLGRLDAD